MRQIEREKRDREEEREGRREGDKNGVDPTTQRNSDLQSHQEGNSKRKLKARE